MNSSKKKITFSPKNERQAQPSLPLDPSNLQLRINTLRLLPLPTNPRTNILPRSNFLSVLLDLLDAHVRVPFDDLLHCGPEDPTSRRGVLVLED